MFVSTQMIFQTRVIVDEILRVSRMLLLLCRKFSDLMRIRWKHADIWFERACTFIHAWRFRQYKLKSRETGTCVAKSSWPCPNPADKPLSCEINTFSMTIMGLYLQCVYYNVNNGFCCVLAQSHIKLNSSK